MFVGSGSSGQINTSTASSTAIAIAMTMSFISHEMQTSKPLSHRGKQIAPTSK
jgi:hypothetical protein